MVEASTGRRQAPIFPRAVARPGAIENAVLSAVFPVPGFPALSLGRARQRPGERLDALFDLGLGDGGVAEQQALAA